MDDDISFLKVIGAVFLLILAIGVLRTCDHDCQSKGGVLLVKPGIMYESYVCIKDGKVIE